MYVIFNGNFILEFFQRYIYWIVTTWFWDLVSCGWIMFTLVRWLAKVVKILDIHFPIKKKNINVNIVYIYIYRCDRENIKTDNSRGNGSLLQVRNKNLNSLEMLLWKKNHKFSLFFSDFFIDSIYNNIKRFYDFAYNYWIKPYFIAGTLNIQIQKLKNNL